MIEFRLVIRGSWNAFGLWLEPTTNQGPPVLVQVFNTLTGVSRAMEKGDAVLRALAGQPKTFLKEKN